MKVNSILGHKSTGSIGNVTLQKGLGGITIGRQKPTEVSNPNSELQQAQRGAFSTAVLFCKLLLPVLRSYFKPRKAIESPYSAAVGVNTNIMKAGNLSDISDLVQNGCITKGSLQPIEQGAFELDATNPNSPIAEVASAQLGAYYNPAQSKNIGIVVVALDGSSYSIAVPAIKQSGGPIFTVPTNGGKASAVHIFQINTSTNEVSNNILIGQASI
jgi:hypothetical protein